VNHYAIPLRHSSARSTVAPCSGRYENVWDSQPAAVWVEVMKREVVFVVRCGAWQCLRRRLCVDGDGCGRGAHRRGAAAPRPHHYHQHHFCSQWRNEACHCSSTSKLPRVRTGDPVACPSYSWDISWLYRDAGNNSFETVWQYVTVGVWMSGRCLTGLVTVEWGRDVQTDCEFWWDTFWVTKTGTTLD